MYYSCSQCRRPLKAGQTLCGCGQVFSSSVPDFDSDGNSMYWPPAAASDHSVLGWWRNLSYGVKALAASGVGLVAAVAAVGGTVGHYQALHARYAPGTPAVAVAASSAPIRTAGPAPALLPAPMVLRAAPRYTLPRADSRMIPGAGFSYSPQSPISDRSQAEAPENAAPVGNSPMQYAAAKADADQAVTDAVAYVNGLTPEDYQRAPISLGTFISRVKQDKATMLESPSVSSQDLAAVDSDEQSIESTQDNCNQNRGAASISNA